MRQTYGRGLRLAGLVMAVGLVAAACGGGGGTSGESETSTSGGGSETATGSEAAGGGHPSGSVTLLHGIKGEEEKAALQAMVDAYKQETGNEVKVEASPDFETVIVTRVTGGNAPDLALYPQPGLLKRVVDQGAAKDYSSIGVNPDDLNSELVKGMVDTGTFDGKTYGTVVKLNIKSLLWYPKAAFDSAGYQVPDSWSAMMDLTDKIANDVSGDSGRAPWCIGIESGGATGWVATDWIEDIMLRMYGPDTYDKWVNHELKFDSPEVTKAFEELQKIWFNDKYVLGGTTGILQTPFADSVKPMFSDPPGCFLHRQAGFITGSFPESAKLGENVAMTYLPAMTESTDVGKPVLFSGDLIAAHTDNPVAADFIKFVLSEQGQEAWLSESGAGALSVRKDFDTSKYPSDALKQQGEILSSADFARFDGSDQMPSEVGAGAFWSEMVAWISGSQDLQTTLKNIDAAWPSS